METIGAGALPGCGRRLGPGARSWPGGPGRWCCWSHRPYRCWPPPSSWACPGSGSRLPSAGADLVGLALVLALLRAARSVRTILAGVPLLAFLVPVAVAAGIPCCLFAAKP